MIIRRRDFLAGGSAAAFTGVLLAPNAFAQVFPARQIHVVVPSSPGGVHDVFGRIWADRVRPSLGVVIVEDRAGGGSSIALNYVVQQAADGHTLLVGSTSTLVLREGGSNRAYDALKEIRSVSILATTSTSIAVKPSLPVASVKELIGYAKANPGKLSYGSGGVGAITHLTPELFKQEAGGLDIVHVPYRGIAPAMNDVLAGQIDVIFPNLTSQVMALHRAGRLRVLAVNAPARLEVAPEIPAASEAGLPNFVSQIFFGIFAPLATPDAVVERIYEATQKEWADEAFQKKLVESGFEPMLDFGPKRSDLYLKEEFAKWNPIVQKVLGP